VAGLYRAGQPSGGGTIEGLAMEDVFLKVMLTSNEYLRTFCRGRLYRKPCKSAAPSAGQVAALAPYIILTLWDRKMDEKESGMSESAYGERFIII